MARPDSDEPLDRLLSGRLRSHHAAAGEACPDPDLLAAFVDGSLDRPERSSIERHASSCSRCAQILAATEASAQTPVAPSQPSIWTAWRAWRWAVPLATAVTVVGVWLAASRPGIPPTIAPAVETPPAVLQTAAADNTVRERPAEQKLVPESPPPRAVESFEAKAAPPDSQTARLAAPAPVAQLAKQEAPAAAPLADSRRNEEAAPAERQRNERSALVARAGTAIVLVRSSDPNLLWRGRGSAIERSEDGGATWRQEHSVPGTIVAGSSPTPDVVWFVSQGGGGFVARRTSLGWNDVTVSDVEIVSIRATSALQATVELAGGGQLETTDGGKSWKSR